ncbi:hypothetical protein ACJX0J_038211, partial [Zea mays]
DNTLCLVWVSSIVVTSDGQHLSLIYSWFLHTLLYAIYGLTNRLLLLLFLYLQICLEVVEASDIIPNPLDGLVVKFNVNFGIVAYNWHVDKFTRKLIFVFYLKEF